MLEARPNLKKDLATKNCDIFYNESPLSRVNVYCLSIFWNHVRTSFQAFWGHVLLSLICKLSVALKMYVCINLVKSTCLLSIYLQKPCFSRLCQLFVRDMAMGNVGAIFDKICSGATQSCKIIKNKAT